MKIIRPFFLWGLILILFNLPALAWEVNVQSDETQATSQVIVSNTSQMNQVDVYLVWADLDGKPGKRYLSWEFNRGWQNKFMPVFSAPIDLPEFESYTVQFQDKTCPENHRCFLAFVATPSGQDPLVGSKNWQAASFLPLSLSAGCERFMGQRFFLSCDDGINRFDEGDDAVLDAVSSTGDAGPPPPPATADKVEAAPEMDGGTAQTEKPDIFKLVGHQLLYANGQAQRFQVIDIADLSNPRLTGWIALTGSPRELYVLGDYYVLLQTHYGSDGSNLTVLRQNEDNSLTKVQDMSLSGRFIESRRRGQFIYSVTEQFNPMAIDCVDCSGISKNLININVLHLTEEGLLEEVDKASVPGYSPTIAIFPDNLVIANHNPEEDRWRTTQIQVFDLSQTDPLVALPTLKVPGQVPSEFHLSVKNQQLRVVYGPEDRQHGSTLAIYDLTSMDLVGQVSEIAPGEALFATRFVDNRAFVVTFERKDPLWVIDLTDSTSPSILGELHVPGWSEKMFFHEDRLFAVGIDDQPLENEENRWVRRVALSLFDVKDPTLPTLINRFTPLAGEVSHSSSPALYDERALLLNWEEAFAALPIETYEGEAATHLQIVSLANDMIEDAGRLESPVSIQRSLSVEENVLAALGDQALLTLRWGAGKPQVLGELELSRNLTWITRQREDLWSAATGNRGYSRLYRYTTTDVEIPIQNWSLPKGYNALEMDDDLAVFYNYHPLSVQVIELNTGKLYPPQQLEEIEKPTMVTGILDDEDSVDVGIDVEEDVIIEESAMATSTISINDEGSVDAEIDAEIDAEKEDFIASDMLLYRSQPLLHEGWFYVAEQRSYNGTSQTATLLPKPEKDEWQAQWVLRSWNLKVENAKEAATRSIPGTPLTFTANGELITLEVTKKIRLNLLALDVGNARLLHSRELNCSAYSRVRWTKGALYVKCDSETGDLPGPIYYSGTREEVNEPITQLLKLNPAQGFTEEGNWTLPGYKNLRAVSGEVVLMAYDWYRPWIGGAMVDKPMIEPAAMTEPAIMPPLDEQNGCDIYQLTPEKEPKLLKHLETCPYNDEGLILTPTQAWVAEGFAGIKVINW